MSITSRYSDIPEVVINESKIPAEVRHLLPLAKEWSISDDVELDDFIKAASREKQREFFEAFRPYFGALDKWHKELAHLVPQPDELVLFDIATNAAATVGSSLHTPKNKPENPWGESLPVKLLRDGWTPHSFPNSTVVVALPPGVTVKFDEKGVLHGFARELGRFFTATLHTNPKFTEDKALALQFVENLAKKKGAEAVDIATYKYFIDPKEGREGSRIITFCVIGIPGAVVVISLSRQPDSPPSELIENVRRAIPQIIGELV